MHRTAPLALGLGVLLLVACGEEPSVSMSVVETPADTDRLFIQVDGMVKALGIT